MIRMTVILSVLITTMYLPPVSAQPAATPRPRGATNETPPVATEQPEIQIQNIQQRGTFQNARIKFERAKTGHVAFIGGSITEMNGYRPMVIEGLQRRFPNTKFTFTDAGISSTCSTTGAFRLRRDVLTQGPVDLFFIEFAVNDDQDAGHAQREALRGMEGIVRQTRLHNPKADIVLTYFVNPGMLRHWQAGETPLAVRAHEQVADHYHIPTINLARQVAQSITAGELTWERFGGTHPQPFGNRIAARMIDRLMTRAWDEQPPEQMTPHPLPAPIDDHSYSRARFIDVEKAPLHGDAQIKIPDWKALGGGFRSRFADRRLLCLDGSDSEIEIRFTGTAIGAYVLAGPDAAKVVARIDNGPASVMDVYHRFSQGLHYPRTVMFATDLPAGEHTLVLGVDPSSAADRQAVRILQFTAN